MESTTAALQPFIGKRIKVRCGRCRRVLAVLTPNVGGSAVSDGTYDGLISTSSQDSALIDVTRKGWPTVLGTRRPVGGRPDGFSRTRWTYRCHQRCGARYTVTGDLLEERFLRAARAGSAEVVLGEG